MLPLTITLLLGCYLIGIWVIGRRLRSSSEFWIAIHYGLIVGGLVFHSLFWVLATIDQLHRHVVPSVWFLWGNLGAWILIAGHLFKMHKRRLLVFGYFIVPLALLMFFIAYVFSGGQSVGDPDTTGFHRIFWRWVHSGSLLLGTLIMIMAFAASVLFMVKSIRLKGKKNWPSVRLPSLEKLGKLGEQGMLVASLAMCLGLISGIVMNLTLSKDGPIVDWLHPVVWTSSILLAWLAAATLFGALYRPARHGRKVAYLCITSGLFIAVEIVLVLATGHGNSSSNPPLYKRESISAVERSPATDSETAPNGQLFTTGQTGTVNS